MRLLNAHTLVPSNLSCALMAIRSFKSKSTNIFPVFRESYLTTSIRSIAINTKHVAVGTVKRVGRASVLLPLPLTPIIFSCY